MNYCFSEIQSPAFFYKEGDCGEVNHDLMIESGGLSSQENQIISALLIQLNSDRLKNGERGFWGEEFMDFSLGNHIWTLQGQPNIQNVTLKADQMIRECLSPIIDQGLIDDFDLTAIRVINGVEIVLNIKKNDKSIFKTVL